LIHDRKPNFDELEAAVRKEFFFLTPLHREIVVSIFDACNALAGAKSIAEFSTVYYDHLDLELPSIGWQLFILDSSQSDPIALPAFLDTYATRLLTEPLNKVQVHRTEQQDR